MPVSAGMSFLCHMGKMMGLDYGSRTVGAMEILEESGVPVSERKTYVDKIAASLILEDYMKNGDKSNG